jgi:DNA-binding transcriptional MerR regulator
MLAHYRDRMTTGVRHEEPYLQIGEAAEQAQLTQRTLRYYEEKGLLKSPSRMEGGFRLYSAEDIERLERIKELRDLLGFSLAEIKEMLEADDVKLQIKSEWRKDADASEKAAKIRISREVTLQQLALVDDKLRKMLTMRDELAERIARYDGWLRQWTEEVPSESVTSA